MWEARINVVYLIVFPSFSAFNAWVHMNWLLHNSQLLFGLSLQLYQHIVLSGGSTMYPGLPSRYYVELFFASHDIPLCFLRNLGLHVYSLFLSVFVLWFQNLASHGNDMTFLLNFWPGCASRSIYSSMIKWHLCQQIIC